MAWQTRPGGQKYFYLSRKQPDGSVTTEYFGCGRRAEIESTRVAARKADRQALLKERQLLAEAEKVGSDISEQLLVAFEAQMYANGFHNPQCRGWRKRRDMIGITDNEQQVPREGDVEVSYEEMPDKDIVEWARRGDRRAAAQLRIRLNDNPDLFGPLGQIACKVQLKWIGLITGEDLFEREMLVRAITQLRASLIAEGDGSTAVRIIIEQVVSTHLQLYYHEMRESEGPADNIRVSAHRLKKIESAFKRHQNSLKLLAAHKVMSHVTRASSPQSVDSQPSKIEVVSPITIDLVLPTQSLAPGYFSQHRLSMSQN